MKEWLPMPRREPDGHDGHDEPQRERGKPGGHTLTQGFPPHSVSSDRERAVEATQWVQRNLAEVAGQTERLAAAISARQFLTARSSAEVLPRLRAGVEGALAQAQELGAATDEIALLRARWAALAPQVASLLAQAPRPDPHHGLDVLGLGHAEDEAEWQAKLAAPAAVAEAAPAPAAPAPAPAAVAKVRQMQWVDEAAALADALGVTAEIRADDAAGRRIEAHGTGTARGLAERGVIYLHPTRLTPGTAQGRQVLIHELMHLAQAQRADGKANGKADDQADRDDRDSEIDLDREHDSAAASGDDRHAAEAEASAAAARGAVAAPEVGIDLDQAAADNDGDQTPRAPPAAKARRERHKLKAGKDGPVFASNGLPYLVTEQGVWVIRDWVMADPDRKTTPRGLLSPSRARAILAAVAWVEPSRIEWAATHLLFSFTRRVDLLQFRTEAFQVTGLPAGTDAMASRGARRGLDVVVALDDPKLPPGSTVAFTEPLRERAVAAVTHLTGLAPDASGLEMLATEPAFQTLKVGNGAVSLTFDEELCDGLFGTEAYQRWVGGKPAKDQQPAEHDAPKLALTNFYQQPVPGTLTHSGDLIETHEPVWFEVQVAWPTHSPDPARYRAPAMVTPGHRDNVALLQCQWQFERLGEPEPASLGPLAAAAANNHAPLDGSGATATHSARSGPAAAGSTAPALARRGAVETARTSVAEIRHAFALEPNQAIGRFRVTVQTRFDEYFAPAEFSQIVVVQSTAATLAMLSQQDFSDLPLRHEQRSAEDFSDRSSGRGSDIHGTRITGELAADFVPSPAPGTAPAADPRAPQRDRELQHLQAMRSYLAAQGGRKRSKRCRPPIASWRAAAPPSARSPTTAPDAGNRSSCAAPTWPAKRAWPADRCPFTAPSTSSASAKKF